MDNDYKSNSSDLIQSEEQNESKNQDCFSIYEYFQKTPSVLIAVASGIIAFISFIIRFRIHLRVSRLLSYWNVDPSLVSSSSKHLFYTICFSFVLAAVAAGASSFLAKSFSSYVDWFSVLRIIDKKSRSTRRLLKGFLKLELKKQKHKTVIKYSDKKKEIEALIADNDAEKKIITQIRVSLIKHYSFRLIIVAILLLLINIIGISFDYSLSISNLIAGSVFATFLEISAFLVTNLFFGFFMIRVKAKDYSQKAELLIESGFKTLTEKSTLDVIKQQGLKPLLTNKKIISCSISICCFILVILFVPLFINTSFTYDHYKCVKTEDTVYISVYSDDDIMILEEVEICDKKARVLTTKQLILPIKDQTITFEIVTFDDVELVK